MLSIDFGKTVVVDPICSFQIHMFVCFAFRFIVSSGRKKRDKETEIVQESVLRDKKLFLSRLQLIQIDSETKRAAKCTVTHWMESFEWDR